MTTCERSAFVNAKLKDVSREVCHLLVNLDVAKHLGDTKLLRIKVESVFAIPLIWHVYTVVFPLLKGRSVQSRSEAVVLLDGTKCIM